MSEQEKKKQVSVREMQVYQTDDGRRIETYTLTGTIDFSMPDSAANPEDLNMDELDNIEVIYIGVLHLSSPMGSREIKFTISDVDSIEEAFGKYYENADKAIEEIKQRAQQEQDSQIVRASEADLNQIDQMDPDGGGIILP